MLKSETVFDIVRQIVDVDGIETKVGTGEPRPIVAGKHRGAWVVMLTEEDGVDGTRTV